MIEASRLTKSFAGGPPILANVELTVAPGEFVALLGPSGCGKSTLLKLIAALDTPSSGDLLVDGVPADRQDASHRRVGYVFQHPTLLPWRNLCDNIALPLELRGVPRRVRRGRAADLLPALGLRIEDGRKYPHQLSGGMQMRVSLARALVTEPDILLLDEPFAALDDLLRGQLNELLVSLWCDRKWTTVFVTHNVSEAVFLSQRILVMRAHPGQIIETIDIPFSHPRESPLRSTAEFARLTGSVSDQLRRTVA